MKSDELLAQPTLRPVNYEVPKATKNRDGPSMLILKLHVRLFGTELNLEYLQSTYAHNIHLRKHWTYAMLLLHLFNIKA